MDDVGKDANEDGEFAALRPEDQAEVKANEESGGYAVVPNSHLNALCELLVSAAVGAIFISKVLPVAVFICLLAGGLLAYVVVLHQAGSLRRTLGNQGVRKPDFRSQRFWHPTAFGVLGAIVLALVGIIRSHGSMPPVSVNLIVCLLIYPFYGWAQQWLVQGLITRNLATLILSSSSSADKSTFRDMLVCITSGFGFSLVHYPDLATIGAVAIIGVAFAGFFLRDADVFPLGLWHGWLGSLFYYWALREDPLGELLQGK